VCVGSDSTGRGRAVRQPRPRTAAASHGCRAVSQRGRQTHPSTHPCSGCGPAPHTNGTCARAEKAALCQLGALNETSGAGQPPSERVVQQPCGIAGQLAHTHTHLELLPPRIPAHTLQLPCLLSRRHRHWAAVGVAGSTRASRSDSVWPCLAAVMCGWLAAAGWSPVVAAALRAAAQLCAGGEPAGVLGRQQRSRLEVVGGQRSAACAAAAGQRRGREGGSAQCPSPSAWRVCRAVRVQIAPTFDALILPVYRLEGTGSC
jgi:hypothetical protein